MKSKKKIQQEALQLWPECPEEYLEESFYFKNEPTAERIVGIGKFAMDVGVSWGMANAYQRLLARIESNQEFALREFPGETMENILLEIHHDFMKAIQFASCWKNPKHPQKTAYPCPNIFKNANMRRHEALDKMHGEGDWFIDDGRSVAQYLAGKS